MTQVHPFAVQVEPVIFAVSNLTQVSSNFSYVSASASCLIVYDGACSSKTFLRQCKLLPCLEQALRKYLIGI